MKFYFRWALTLVMIGVVGALVICTWSWLAGPNIDTMLTYHRNLIAHSFHGMFQILAGQDQAPLPQLLDYVLYLSGFSSVLALQFASSTLIIAAVLWILALDLKTNDQYQKIQVSWRPVVYALSAIAMIVSPSFSVSLTWVRYAAIVGICWYAVWVLEEKILTAADLQLRKYAIILGAMLGLGLLISYTWGVVIVASLLSLAWRRQLHRPGIRSSLLLGAIPGVVATFVFLIYAGSMHLSLILLRSHAHSGLIKTIGEAWGLLIYPLVGSLLFPGVINTSISIVSLAIIGYSVFLFLRIRRDYVVPFLCHVILPVPFFILTAANSGYGMIGPGLILMSCAIKGALQLSIRRSILFVVLGMVTLTAGMLANLHGFNTVAPEMYANKSRAALDAVISRLSQEHALNDQTLVVACDESTLFLAESSLPTSVRRRYSSDEKTSTAPNVEAMLRVGYRQDTLTPAIHRVVVIQCGSRTFYEDFQFFQKWLHNAGFTPSPFQQKIGTYSSWLQKATTTTAPAQYVIEEWSR